MIDMVSSNNTFANNSMIFKTIDSSVDNTRKTLALFNKDWNTYKTNWQQGFSQNGVAGGIKSIFQSSNSNSVISKDQLQILRNWNNAVAHGCTNQETFNRIIKDADSNTKLYFSGLNKGKGSVEGLKNAQNVAKQSTIGLTLAQTALNAAISLGFTAALMLAVKGLDKLINSAKRASEAADEAFSDTTEKVQKNEEEAKSLDELISKYKELKESENLDVDGRKEIKEIQNDIADLVGVQASNLDLVNGKLDDEIAKLDEISAKEAKNAYETATANYNNSKKATDKAAGDDSFLFVDGYSYTGKREKEAEKVLKNAGFGGNVQSGGFFGNTLFVMDSFDNDMKELKGAQEKADYLQSMIDVLEQNGQRATDLYAGLISQRDKYLQYIDNQQDAANSLVNSWISYSQFSNDELSKINVDSLDSFEEYRQKMIEEAKNDESIGKMLADGTLSDEDLENAVNDFMATSTKFSTWYEQWIGNIESDVQHETPISPTSFEDAWTTLDSTDEDAIKTLKKDLLEAAEAGQLSAEKFNELDKTEYFKNIGISADSAIEKINGLVNASTQLSSMSTQISKMSDMLADKKNGTVASASDLAGFDAEVRGLDSWKEFESVMGSTTSTIEECQAAANALASEWINNGNFLANLTDQNRDYYETQLSNMGIENSHIIVLENLSKAGYELSDAEQAELDKAIQAREEIYALQLQEAQDFLAKKDLNVAAQDAYVGLMQEAEGAGISKVALVDLIAQEQVFNNSGLSTSSKISELSALASAYLGTAAAAQFAANTSVSGMGSDPRYFTKDYVMDQWTNALSNYKVNFDLGSYGSRKYKAPSTPKKSKSESAKKTSQEFNLIEILINNINRSIDKLDAKISNTWSSWSKRNKALISELKQVKKLENTQTKAANYYKKKASNVKLDSKTKKQLRDGAINIKTVKDEKLANKMQKYQDYWESYKQYTDDAADSAQKYFDLLEQKFDDIQSKWDSRIGYQENRKNAVSDALNLAQSKGKLIGTAYYTKQKGINDKEINKYKQEETELKKAMKGVKKYSEQWYQYKADLSEVHSKYVQLQADNAELQRSINELKFDRFDELISKFNDISDEANFLIDMLDSDNLFNSDNGSITNDGITAMGLTAQNYDVYLAETEQYKKQIADLEQMYKNGNGTIGYNDYISKLREYQQGMRDSIKSANDAKKAVVDYVKQGLDAQNEALSKSIDKQKSLLEAEKDLHNFQSKIADQNKNIANLRKQIAALEGDDSEENRKKLQQLKSDLQDAEQEQKDTLYDRSIEDSISALDKMVTDAEDMATQYLKNSEKVFVDALGYVNKNTEQVSNNIEKISNDLGISISTYITNAWKDSGDAVGTYESTLSSNVPKITAQIQLITNAWNAQCEAADKAAQASANAAAGSDETTKDTYKKGNSSNGSGNKSKTSSAKDIKRYITDHVDKAKQKKSYYGALNRYLYEKTGGKVLSVSEEVQLAKMLGVSVKKDLSGTGDRQKILDALKKKKIAFANGGVLGDLVKLSGEDGLFIGSAGKSILTKEQTQALIDFRPAIPQFGNMMDILKNVSVNSRAQSPTYNIDNRTIVEGVATDQIVKEMEGVAQKQAENVVRKINSATYAKGVRR